MTNVSVKSIVAVAVSAIVALYACAEEVSADSAGIAAQRWLEDDAALGCSLGLEVDAVRTCSPQEGATFHVVKLKGNGFVVMSSDTAREPVVAFSSGGDLVESDNNPLWVLLKNDLALRVREDVASSGKSGLLKANMGGSSSSGNEAKWNRLLGKSSGLLRTSQGVSAISDVRVAPLVRSRWNQDNVAGDYCYNYYTPNHYVCGCVATAGAQIMRYFEWPRSSVNVAKFTNKYCYLQGTKTTYTTQGGYYDWSLMPLVPNSTITEAERQTIGKLTSDIGICVGMDYDAGSNGGSSAGGYMLADAFTNHYCYANALAAEWGTNVDISGTDDMKNAFLSNFDAGLPVAIGLFGDGGHEIVGDGYGYSGDTLYIHFNMGWSGSDDAWYAPPNMAGTYDFSGVDGFVCNIFTNSAYANGVICSGRVLDSLGAPIENAVVSVVKKGSESILRSTTTNAKGIYALVITGVPKTATTYTLTATSSGFSATKDVSLKANVGVKVINSGSSFGRYSGTPAIGNKCGQDITIADIVSVAEPQINPASCLFYPSTNVAITCVTAGATIRYTTDGTDPTESSPIYLGPVFVDDDTVVKARAWKSGMNPSAVAAEMYTYDSSQGVPKGDYFADPIKIADASGSRVVADIHAYSTETGEPRHTNYSQFHTVWYKWAAPGSGTMTFTTDLQGYNGGTFIAAYTGNALSSLTRITYCSYSNGQYPEIISFSVEQGTTYYIVGMVSDSSCSGAFTLAWSGNLTVMPTETSTTEVPVTYVWLDEYFPGGASATEDYETIAKADADGDGLDTWAEYLLGTDPTNASSRLVATIRMDGSTPIVESNADTNRLATFGYQPVVKGKQTLDPAVDWANMDSLLHRFFKVFVEKNVH